MTLSCLLAQLLLLLHLLLACLASLGNWAGPAYTPHNLALLACLVWALAAPDCEDSVCLALAVNTGSIGLDLIILAVHYPR